jgi:hypothetical protein
MAGKAGKLTMEDRLQIISRAWGKQKGYVFFPWIRGDAEEKVDRIKGYHEGPAFKWPADKARILEHMRAHTSDDLYWCPSIFEKKVRRADLAMDEHALWADLDAKDPRDIEDYPPSIAWESSPGRYQALWIISGGDVQGASWPGNENQRLTYHIGADPSGWDTTQLLRIPAWRNHKPDYRDEDGKSPKGKLLWKNGRRYLPDDFEELPKVEAGAVSGELVDALTEEVERVDRHKVWANVRLKLPKTARELMAAKEAQGDRSEKLWWLMRCLADVGVSAVEIVAVVRETPWNKFAGRQDELKRLLTEATKAVASRSEETKEKLEQEGGDYPDIVNLMDAIAKYEPPKWLVQDLIADESVGFIAGQPKSFKTWFGLDLAISVATGADFLEYFKVHDPGPVLYIQAEDGPAMIKLRAAKVLPNKRMDRVRFSYEATDMDGEPQLVWEPPSEDLETPKIAAPDPERMDEPPIISEPGWQGWLDETLERGYLGTKDQPGEKYRLVILDPLMMMAGDVEENKAHAMTSQIYKPLLLLARKHHLALLVVHHMKKTNGDEQKSGQARGGQLMLGSVANHAWSQNSMYVTHGRYSELIMETESKFASGERYSIKNLRSRKGGKDTWEPRVEVSTPGSEKATGKGQGTVSKKSRSKPSGDGEARGRGRPRNVNPPALRALKLLVDEKAKSYTTHEVKDKLAEMIGKPATQTIYLQAYQQLKKCWEHGQVKRVDKNWFPAGAEHDEAEELDI